MTVLAVASIDRDFTRTVGHQFNEIADNSFLVDLIFVAFIVVKAAGHSVGHFAFRGVVVERLTHFVGLMVSVLVLFVGARKASS